MATIRYSKRVQGQAVFGAFAFATLGYISCSTEADPSGASATGGNTVAQTGGAPGTGGAGKGGSSTTAGMSSGAVSSGGANTGGSIATGGSLAATGGTTAVGGQVGKGGGNAAGSPGGGAGGKAGTGGGSPGGAATTGGSGSGTAGAGGAVATSGCGASKAPASGEFTIDVDGTMREYILALPDDYDSSRPYPLVFGWHPLGGSASQVANGGYYGLERVANGGAIFVAGEGLPFQGGNLGWANSMDQDLAFLDAMLARFRTELCFDESRIFSTGFSFGGMMSFAVGCQTTGVMRAIAPMAGNIQVSRCQDGTRPVAVMGFHGDDDSVVAIDGGRAGRDVFIERNGCMETSSTVTGGWCDGVNTSNEPCTCVSYDGCTAGYPVIWCEFNGPHTPAPNSAQTIWDFFSQF